MHAHKVGERVYVDKNVWHELQMDGNQKWYAIDPDTGAVAEINADQAYFWTEDWQAQEREADDDVVAGRVDRYDTTEDFLASLKPRE